MKHSSMKHALCGAVVVVATMTAPALAGSPSDGDIALWVKSALRHDPHVDPAGITVEVKKGIVTLTGGAHNLASKTAALEEAKKIDGVVGIIDELHVSTGWRPDADVAQDVRHRIVNNEMIESSWISTTCKDGTVTMHGKVGSWAEKQEAGIVAGEVRGVRKIVNDLSVDYSGLRSDEEIKQDAEAKLDLDVYLNGLPITVAVNDGVVTLSGSVGSKFEKDRADREVRYLSHVTRVENDLKVEYWEKRGTRTEQPKPPSNHELKKRVKRMLEQDTRVKASKIDVDTASGHVTLSGSVPYSYQKRIAEEDAKHTIGTAWVTNHLLVTGIHREDPSIRSDILSNLDSDYSLSGMGVSAYVKDGTVTLSGYVNSGWEKQHAEEVVTRVRGVKDIKNHIKVEHDQFSDSALVRDVRNRFSHNWITSPVHKDISVSIADGVATLTGDVDTWRERAEAARVALGTAGIWGVHNRTTVRGVAYPWDEWDEEVVVLEPYWWIWHR